MALEGRAATSSVVIVFEVLKQGNERECCA